MTIGIYGNNNEDRYFQKALDDHLDELDDDSINFFCPICDGGSVRYALDDTMYMYECPACGHEFDKEE